MKTWWKKVTAAVRSVSIVDRFLILFMVILFFYTTIHPFLWVDPPGATNTIDVIVRTSMASIFGYFLSSPFIQMRGSARTSVPAPPAVSIQQEQDSSPLAQGAVQGAARGAIGFRGPVSSGEEAAGGSALGETETPPTASGGRLQVAVVGMVGLVSLVVLLVIRQFQDATPELSAIVSQLRDFVSASIGFLVSCGKTSNQS